MSINIEGFSSLKGDVVREYFKRTTSDVLCMQETHRGRAEEDGGRGDEDCCRDSA